MPEETINSYMVRMLRCVQIDSEMHETVLLDWIWFSWNDDDWWLMSEIYPKTVVILYLDRAIAYESCYSYNVSSHWLAAGHARVHIQHYGCWWPGAKAPGLQYPKCWWNNNFIAWVSYENIIFIMNRHFKRYPNCIRAYTIHLTAASF